MKIKTSSVVSVLALAAWAVYGAPYAFASFPALTLSSNGSMVQAIVSNADPNSTVMLYYPSGGPSAPVTLGTTDPNGYLTAQINPGSYSISMGNPVYVRVNDGQSPTATWPVVSNGSSGSGASLYLTQTTASLAIGQSVSITASNVVGSLSVPGNTNPSAATASVDGNIVTVTGLANGTSAITVCASASGCSTVNVTVQPSYLSSPGVYINPNSMNIAAGQSQTASITGYASGPYYVSSNTGSNAVSASVNNNSLILTGLSAGSSNITVCATGGQCGMTFVAVSSNGTATASNLSPALSSVTIASNGSTNAFIAGGMTVTLSFNANQPIVNPQVRMNGTNILVNGSGAGPYSATYTVTGSETMPIPVAISFANASGAIGRAYLWVGNSSSAPSNTTTAVDTATTVAPSATSAPSAVPAASGSYSFARYLYMGMTKLNVADPDVTALQQRLKTDGIYSGPVTGYFGAQTKAAVEAYQKKHGLSPLGVIGPSTRDLLNRGI